MDPGAQLSLFSAWRHPVMGAGMELSQAAYRYNQNMMEYYTCKSELGLAYDSTSDSSNNGSDCFQLQATEVLTS